VSKDTVLFEYTLQQAIADGVLVEVFKNRWKELTNGKPIVATSHLFHEVSLAALLEIWNEFVHWKRPTPPENPDEQIFTVAGICARLGHRCRHRHLSRSRNHLWTLAGMESSAIGSD